MMKKIVELLIDMDNVDFQGEVDIMSLVDRPAIGIDWMAFADELAHVDNKGMEKYKKFLDANVDMMKKPGGGPAGDGGVDHGAQMKILEENGIDTGYPFGYCFQIAQFLFYALGGYESEWELKLIKGMEFKVGGQDFKSTHWYVQNSKTFRIVDLSAEQFDGILDIEEYYPQGRNANLGYPYYNVGDKKVEFENTVPSLQTLKLYALWREEHGKINHLEEFYTASKYEELRRDFEEEELKSEEEQLEDKLVELALEYGETYDLETDILIDATKEEFSTLKEIGEAVTALDILRKYVKKDAPAEQRYRYAGPKDGNTRGLCRKLLSMNKLYTIQDLRAMGAALSSYGAARRGQAYSVFKFKGGVNCRHAWNSVKLANESGKTIMIDQGPVRDGNTTDRLTAAEARDAGQIAGPQNNYWRRENMTEHNFQVVSEDQQIVVGPSMVPQKLIARRDEEGNLFYVYFSKETIRKIAEKWLAKGYLHNTDVNHDMKVTQENTLLESWIVDDPKTDKSTKLGYDLPEGTWMTSYRINNKDTWDKIKNGQLNGYSIAGTFIEKLAR